MTYIVGLKTNGATAIISDTRQTGPEGGENVVLKTGTMFPGCIFGRAGSAEHSRDFVLRARHALLGDVPIPETWYRFKEFCDSYIFPTGSDSFELILSTRSSGRPLLFRLDSDEGLSPVDEEIVTIGSGKAILDDFVLGASLPLIKQARAVQRLPIAAGPYILCFLLTLTSRGLEQTVLEDHGVGGVFHFTYQTADSDGRQRPAVYILPVPDFATNNIYHWIYRVAFAQDGLFVHTLIPPGVRVDAPNGLEQPIYLLSEASGRLPTDRESLRRLRREIQSEIDSQPYYWFCGVGAPDPTVRGALFFHVKPAEDYLVDKDGNFSPLFAQVMLRMFGAPGGSNPTPSPSAECEQCGAILEAATLPAAKGKVTRHIKKEHSGQWYRSRIL